MSEEFKNQNAVVVSVKDGEDACISFHGVAVGELIFDADRGSYDFYQQKKLTHPYASKYALESDPSDCETGSVSEAATWVAEIIEDATFDQLDVAASYDTSLSIKDFEGYEESKPAIEVY